MNWIPFVNSFLWQGFMPVFLIVSHLFFTFYLGFPQKHTLRGIKFSFSSPKDKSEKSLSPFATLATILAATIGTGNIVGVSSAIFLGGPGALFWCWITGIFGMATCYAECLLSCLYRTRSADGTMLGGPVHVIRTTLGSYKTAFIYGFCTLLAGFLIGSATQANSIAQTLNETWSVPSYTTGTVLTLFITIVIFSGSRIISRVCTTLVPVMTLLFLLCCGWLLFINRQWIIPSIKLILVSAFEPRSAAGGLVGGGFMLASRYGIARGLFTNEAGLGTAAIAASSGSGSAKKQALISMTAVFWDTVVMCLITGLVIICNLFSHPQTVVGIQAGSMTAAAFSTLPFFGREILSVCLVLFALSTLIGWSYYGLKTGEELLGAKFIPIFRILYIITTLTGCLMNTGTVWESTDIMNAVMFLINVPVLFLLRKKIRNPQNEP